MRAFLLVATLATAVSCGHDYVKVDALALGRVVVYRNGVAYFERRARLQGDELSLSVPRDKVDDFLKSLTVKDAKSGKSLPVSFPSPGAEHGGMIDMKIKLSNAPSTDVILTYITDAPAWKPSYRVVIGDDGKVKLESWAIVDNTSGENWNDVLVGVGSSSALSFRYDLWSIRSVHRQTLASQQQFALAPPRGASPYTDTKQGTLITELGDDDIPRPTTHPEAEAWNEDLSGSYADSVSESVERSYSVESVTMGGMQAGSVATDPPAPSKAEIEHAAREKARLNRIRKKRVQGQQRVKQLADSLKASGRKVRIEGNAGPGETRSRGLDRANVLRNQLIDQGVPPAQLEVQAIDSEEGRPAGVRLIAEQQETGADGKPMKTDESPVGESHFQSATPMSVQRGSSVMVSIVNDETNGEVVYLYDAESTRGNNRYAFKAVRLKNPTKNTLETGPVTVYGEGRFVGEGLTDPIPPEATALVPFALDRQVIVETDHSMADQIASLVTLQRGVLTAEVQHIRKTALKLTNRMRKPVTVYVRHTVQDGWKLVDSPELFERLGHAHLFPIELDGGETREIAISEATPLTKTLDLRSPAALDMVQVFLSSAAASDADFAGKMKELLVLNKAMADHQQAISSLRERMGDYRVRMDELHVQIVTLKKVKSGGTLLRHLNKKMKEISDRVQNATIDLVGHQEKLMLARIKFQDAVAELTIQDSKLAKN
jgi:hypothetical protein